MNNDSIQNYLGFEKEEIESSIVSRFELIVNKYPDNIAVKINGDSITYQELNAKANQIATIIKKRSREIKPVFIILEQDVQQFIALIAILKTGSPYVILEPSLAPERLRYIAEKLDIKLALTNTDNLSLAEIITFSKCKLINLDKIEDCIVKDNLNLSISPKDLATITFTSGSTGKPKGVKRSHRPILHRVWFETNDYRISSKEKISLLYSTNFSASTNDIYNALLNGASLCVYNLKQKGVYPLTEWLIREKISFLHLPSIFFREWLEILTGKEKFNDLRQITPSGRLYRRDVEKARQHLTQNTIIIQRLASSETGINTRFVIDNNTNIETNIVPVGYPVPDKEILLLDEKREILAFNQVGEIAVKSRYLDYGYWHNEELTQQKYFPCADEEDMYIYLTGDMGKMQPDGCLELLGRRDFQAKIRDYTVNLTEIEIALLDLNQVKEVVVITHEYSPQDMRIIAYLTKAENSSITVKQLNQSLRKKLPEYMIPSSYVFLDYLPVEETGKIYYQALKIPELTRNHLDNNYVAPTNFIEKKLAQIWQKVLRVDKIGINDNFLELGGNSLCAAQIINRIVKQLGVEVSLQKFVTTPTIAELAEFLSKENGKAQEAIPGFYTLCGIRTSGTRTPFFWIHSQMITFLPKYLDQEQPLYALIAQGVDGKRVRYKTMKEITAHYLREIRAVQPSGPYFLGGFCWGAKYAFEIAQQLLGQGEEVGLLFVVEPLLAPAPSNQTFIDKLYPRFSMHRRRFAGIPLSGKMRSVFDISIRKLRYHRIVSEVYLRAGRRMSPSLSVQYALDVIRQTHRQFSQETYPNEIKLIQAETGGQPIDSDWSNLAEGGVKVHVAPCATHMDLLQEPGAGFWAEWLDRYLREAQANYTDIKE